MKRSEALLDELRSLAATHPEDAAVRAQLATRLSNALVAIEEEQDRKRSDALLDELCSLAAASP